MPSASDGLLALSKLQSLEINPRWQGAGLLISHLTLLPSLRRLTIPAFFLRSLSSRGVCPTDPSTASGLQVRWVGSQPDASCRKPLRARICPCSHVRHGTDSQQCRLTALTSLCVTCKGVTRHPQLDLSSISQLHQLRELRLEKYSSAADEGGLAYLPLSLTSLDLVCKHELGQKTNTKPALGRLVHLQRLRFCGDGIVWEELSGSLADISGLLDLDIFCRSQITSISSFSLFVHLTRLSASCNRGRLRAAVGRISSLSELQELHLVGIRTAGPGEEEPDRNHPEIAAALSRLSLLTSFTLTAFRVKGALWPVSAASLAGLQTLGLRHCSFPAPHCIAELSSATALRSLDLSEQEHKIGPRLSVITHSQQLTYLNVSWIFGLESQHLCFAS